MFYEILISSFIPHSMCSEYPLSDTAVCLMALSFLLRAKAQNVEDSHLGRRRMAEKNKHSPYSQANMKVADFSICPCVVSTALETFFPSKITLVPYFSQRKVVPQTEKVKAVIWN